MTDYEGYLTTEVVAFIAEELNQRYRIVRARADREPVSLRDNAVLEMENLIHQFAYSIERNDGYEEFNQERFLETCMDLVRR